MPLNIRQLKESIGIHLLFLLALTSAFLGVYITVYDLFGGGRVENPEKNDNNLPYDLIRTPFGPPNDILSNGKTNYSEKYHRINQVSRAGSHNRTQKENPRNSGIQKNYDSEKNDFFENKKSPEHNTILLKNIKKYKIPRYDTVKVNNTKEDNFKFHRNTQKYNSKRLNLIRPKYNIWPYYKKNYLQFISDNVRQYNPKQYNPLVGKPEDITLDTALADIHNKINQSSFQISKIGTVFLTKKVSDRKRDLRIKKE